MAEEYFHDYTLATNFERCAAARHPCAPAGSPPAETAARCPATSASPRGVRPPHEPLARAARATAARRFVATMEQTFRGWLFTGARAAARHGPRPSSPRWHRGRALHADSNLSATAGGAAVPATTLQRAQCQQQWHLGRRHAVKLPTRAPTILSPRRPREHQPHAACAGARQAPDRLCARRR
jgi:hypothetical protein